jgi:hypothetical protein
MRLSQCAVHSSMRDMRIDTVHGVIASCRSSKARIGSRITCSYLTMVQMRDAASAYLVPYIASQTPVPCSLIAEHSSDMMPIPPPVTRSHTPHVALGTCPSPSPGLLCTQTYMIKIPADRVCRSGRTKKRSLVLVRVGRHVVGIKDIIVVCLCQRYLCPLRGHVNTPRLPSA